MGQQSVLQLSDMVSSLSTCREDTQVVEGLAAGQVCCCAKEVVSQVRLTLRVPPPQLAEQLVEGAQLLQP